MTDRPDAARLLRAMAATLTEEVVPATTGGPQHAARVVANLCRILEREWTAGEEGEAEIRAALAALLGKSDSSSDVMSDLDERLRRSDEAFDAKAARILLTDVRRRLEINRPGYDS